MLQVPFGLHARPELLEDEIFDVYKGIWSLLSFTLLDLRSQLIADSLARVR